jgi:hypothetical protein
MVSNQKVLILYLLSRKQIWMYQSAWNYPLVSIQLMFQILIAVDTSSSLIKVCMDSSKQNSIGLKNYKWDSSFLDFIQSQVNKCVFFHEDCIIHTYVDDCIHANLEKYFSFQPHSCTSPGKILLITHQEFLQAAFCELPWCPFLPSSSRLPFIGIDVAFLVTSCNKQPFASFLMLPQGFCSLVLVLLLLPPHGQTASCILLMPTHIPLTPFSWGAPLELV